MSYSLVRDLAADGIPVTVTCRVLKIARRPYYRWLANPVTAVEIEEAYRDRARRSPRPAAPSTPVPRSLGRIVAIDDGAREAVKRRKHVVSSAIYARHLMALCCRAMAVNRDDVARRASVSSAVVSYVINNGPKPVAAATRERVLAAIDELSYRPHRAARQLALGDTKSHTLGLIVGSLDEYLAEVAELFTTAATERGYQVFVATSGHDVERERAHLIDMAERRVDGVIVLPVQPSPENLAFADTLELPVLALDRPEIASRRTRAATNHLIEHGHTRIGLITGAADLIGSQRRIEAWQQALEDAGLDADSALMTYARSTRADGYRAAEELFALDDRPTGLVVYTDTRALGAVRAAADHGVAIPDDLAIISTQGSASMAYTVPSISVVAQPVGALAHGALEAILALAHGEPGEVTNLEYEVLGRESCGCTAPHIRVLEL